MNEYNYSGPVRNMYNDIRLNKWETKTVTTSSEKAISNLRYRYSILNKCSIGDVKLNPKYLTKVREGV